MTETSVEIESVEEAVFGDEGRSSIELRRAVEAKAAYISGLGEDVAVPADLNAWIDKVARNAYKTTDSDVERLKQAGYTEDEIFEFTVAAALGAAGARFKLATAAVFGEEASSDAS